MNSPYQIDWYDQWRTHAPDFRDGYVPIRLNDSIGIKLLPGPGFGDFSHPTTQMMVNFLKNNPLHPIFIDVGSGSGILTLSASALGVKNAYGIEIDPHAVDHAKKNREYNSLNSQFFTPDEFRLRIKGPVTIAMNMIRSEQRQAWESLPQIHHVKGDLFSSGVLIEETEEYLRLLSKWGWKFESVLTLDRWAAFHCKK